MQILYMRVNKTEQNFDDKFPAVGTQHLKMPDKCQGGIVTLGIDRAIFH